ncbi:MAG: hypothetical protein QXL94_07645 [Candidatus Parvarchaeum sp.]
MKQPEMDNLVPSFDPPEQWRRSEKQKLFLKSNEWKKIRQRILKRDNNTCKYCGYFSDSFMNVDYIDGNPENNSDSNLQTLCMWCHMIKHAGLWCNVKKCLELYKKPREQDQVNIIKETRKLRGEGFTNEKIKEKLNLKNKMDFNMNHQYLSKLVGFINSNPVEERGY